MEQSKKETLTESLKEHETTIHHLKIESKSIRLKIKISNDYETNLLERLEKCRKDRVILYEDLNKANSNISSTFNKMKSILDVFTSNFYNE